MLKSDSECFQNKTTGRGNKDEGVNAFKIAGVKLFRDMFRGTNEDGSYAPFAKETGQQNGVEVEIDDREDGFSGEGGGG